jgi:ribosome-associated protein
VFEIGESVALSQAQRERLMRRFGPRVTAVAQDARSQARNRELALERLEERLRAALKPRRRRQATKPSRGAKERRLASKRHQARRKTLRRRPSAED